MVLVIVVCEVLFLVIGGRVLIGLLVSLVVLVLVVVIVVGLCCVGVRLMVVVVGEV